jgi:hypothetical protein
MPYILVEDFRVGMDRRRPQVAAEAGSLHTLVNAHITQGGDIERRRAFVPAFTLPAGTAGLVEVGDSLTVFGPGPRPSGLAAQIGYQRLQHPSNGAASIVRVLDTELFDGKVYAIAEFSDGSIFHYYDAVRVAGWDAIAAAVSSNAGVASALAAKIDAQSAFIATASGTQVTIEAAVAGDDFTITAAAQNFGWFGDQSLTLATIQANRTAVAEVAARAHFDVTGGSAGPGVNKVASVKVDGIEVLGAAVDWAGSHSATAAAVAAQVNASASSPDYTATAVGPRVEIMAPAGLGASVNARLVTVVAGGDVTVTPASTPLAGGVTAVTALPRIVRATVGGTFEAADRFTITLDGVAYVVSGAAAGTGRVAKTFKSKLYSLTRSLAYYSALNNPAMFGSGLGSGFLNISSTNTGASDLTAVEEYLGNLAFFSRGSIQIWAIDVDDQLNRFLQPLSNTGTRAPGSVVSYGNTDVFYLAETGIRSLRSRDSSNTAFASDVGTPIDREIRAYMGTLDEAVVAAAVGVLEPAEGRYWLAVGTRIYVFSFFPGPRISAWSYYEVGFQVTAFAKPAGRLYARAGNTIFLYGGASGEAYPGEGEGVVEVVLPFLTGGRPANFKLLTGIDASLEGTWSVDVLVDPSRPEVAVAAGTLARTTYPDGRLALAGRCTHFAPRLTCAAAGYALLSNLAVHYELEEGG